MYTRQWVYTIQVVEDLCFGEGKISDGQKLGTTLTIELFQIMKARFSHPSERISMALLFLFLPIVSSSPSLPSLSLCWFVDCCILNLILYMLLLGFKGVFATCMNVPHKRAEARDSKKVFSNVCISGIKFWFHDTASCFECVFNDKLCECQIQIRLNSRERTVTWHL